jgi:glycine/D-amino acid oxidase-like deaminating enzyme
MQAHGYPFKILDRNELRADEPHLAADMAAGLEVACDGSLNPMALACGLMHGAKKRAAKIQLHTSVTDIKRGANGRIECVVTDRGKINTRKVVNAAGIWAADIGNMVGLDIRIFSLNEVGFRKIKTCQHIKVDAATGCVRIIV